MGISAITRDYGDNVSIVRITASDTLATISASGYLTAQTLNIQIANNGDFSWLSSDVVLVNASNGWGFFTISADFTSLNQFGSFSGSHVISNTTATYGGGGTSNTFAALGLTSSSKGSAVIRTSANSVAIAKAVPGINTLAITFTADPGAGTTVDYIYSTIATS